MPTSLTGSQVRNIYQQLLHVSGGLSATRGIVYDGDGTASALLVGTDNVAVDNLMFDGNTIVSLDTNGNINLTPNGTGSVVISKASITTGVISALSTPLPVAAGGTGGATASAARTALGLGTIATQDANNVALTGGTLSTISSINAAAIRSTTSLGMSTGAGGTVTQATSKSTGVTLNKACGQITMHNASLGAATSVSFTLTDSEIASVADVVLVNIGSGATTNAYTVTVDNVAVGSCRIHVRNETAGALGEALVLNFMVLRGSTS